MKIDIAHLIEKYRDGLRAVRKRIAVRDDIIRSPKRIAKRRKPSSTGGKSDPRGRRPTPKATSDRTPTGRRGRRAR